jgi:hypothetical protein
VESPDHAAHADTVNATLVADLVRVRVRVRPLNPYPNPNPNPDPNPNPNPNPTPNPNPNPNPNTNQVAEGWAAAARGLADTWLGLAADAKAEGG